MKWWTSLYPSQKLFLVLIAMPFTVNIPVICLIAMTTSGATAKVAHESILIGLAIAALLTMELASRRLWPELRVRERYGRFVSFLNL